MNSSFNDELIKISQDQGQILTGRRLGRFMPVAGAAVLGTGLGYGAGVALGRAIRKYYPHARITSRTAPLATAGLAGLGAIATLAQMRAREKQRELIERE